MKTAFKTIIGLAACLAASLAQAHEGAMAAGIFAGLTHPLNGLDHLAALMLSGFMIGRMTKSRHLAVAGLICALALGAVGGILTGAQAAVETTLLLSVPIAIAFQWIRQPGRLNLAIATMGLFMLAHGWAHGTEASGMTGSFVIGFLVTSAFILGLCALISHRASTPRRSESGATELFGLRASE